MDTDALRWFSQVADGVTVTEVSEIEGVSQPGVSRALARLEAEVGTPLLRRVGRTLRMTHAGSAFKRHVDALLHQLDDGLAAIDQIVDPDSGTVSLAFQMSLGSWLVPDLIRSFAVEHPGVRFAVTQVRDELVDVVVTRGDADLVLSTVRPTTENVQRQRLVDEPLRLAVAADHPLARTSSVRLADAASEPFLMLQPTSVLRTFCEELCAAAGFRPTVSFEGEDVHTLRGFVAAGLGVSIIPASGGLAEGATAAVRYLTLTDVRAEREIGLVWSSDRRLLPAVELFREHVVARARGGDLPSLS